MSHIENKSIVLFDGGCNLCSSSVSFIIRYDKKERFQFASLQSDAGKEIMLQCNSKKNKIDAIVLAENGKISYASTAILLIFRKLRHPVCILYIFILFPKSWRDMLYFAIAKRRYRWFGNRSCEFMPESGIAERFIQ